MQALVQTLKCTPRLALRLGRKMQVAQLAVPGAFTAVQGLPLRLGQCRQRIALCRMQPPAPQIQHQAIKGGRARASPEPRQRFDQQHGPVQFGQASRGCDSCCATAHYGHIHLITHGHVSYGNRIWSTVDDDCPAWPGF